MMLRLLPCLACALSPILAFQLPLLESALNPGPDFQRLFGASWSPDLYNGLVTLFQAEPVRCWGLDRLASSDIAILGAPFDTAVTYRTGARFGP
jgi:hypothetical protein